MQHGAENAWPDTLMSWSTASTDTSRHRVQKPDVTRDLYTDNRAQNQAANTRSEAIAVRGKWPLIQEKHVRQKGMYAFRSCFQWG